MTTVDKCPNGTCHQHPGTHSAPVKACCPPPPPQSDNMATFLRVVELVTLVGLAGFAAYTNYRLFVPFAGAGVLMGMYIEFEAIEKNEQSAIGRGQACTQSFFTQLTRVELPPLCGIAVNAGMTYAHIVDHHCCHITCPIAGFNAGAFVGAMIVRYGTRLVNTLSTWNAQTTTT